MEDSRGRFEERWEEDIWKASGAFLQGSSCYRLCLTKLIE
jgi:hypothetical protein